MPPTTLAEPTPSWPGGPADEGGPGHPGDDATALGAALDAGCLEVHYQPIVALPSQHILGFEALARLRLPDGTLLPPEEFVPIAERSGMIHRLGRTVLCQALAEAARWRRSSTRISTATVSVNVAPAQLSQDGFVELVAAALADSGLPGSVLILEITENSVTSPAVRPVLERLSDMGIRIALDDFGIGFATLDNVRRLPVHVLKLDRSFVAGITRAGADRAIVRVVVDLADSLGLSVVAEGVETDEQVEILLRLRCPCAQGHRFAEPGADPEQVARQVGPAAEPESIRAPRTYPWPSTVDDDLLAALHLLSAQPDPLRDAVHCVALELGRQVGLGPARIRLLSYLALVHDVGRLTVDHRPPAAFVAQPTLAALLAPDGPDGPDDPDSPDSPVTAATAATLGPDDRLLVEIVGLAARVARRAIAASGDARPTEPDVDLLADALAAALLAESAADPGTLLRAAAGRAAGIRLQPVDVSEVAQELRRRRAGRQGMEERLRSLVGITRVMASSRDNRELLRAALEEVRRIVGAASASLERWERDHGHLRCLVNVGELGPGEETFPENEIYRLADYAQPRRTLLAGLPYVHSVDDAHADVEAVALLRSLGKYSSAAIPISLEGRLWGQLWLATAPGEPAFSGPDVELLMAVAALLGSVIVQAEGLDRMSRLAFEDPLTRLGNRRCVDDALARLAAEGRRATAVLLDVDLLKQINDNQGHAYGDEALIRLADALSSGLADRPGTTIGRLGGDEFCVILDDADAAEATDRVGQILRALAADGGPSASMGVAASGPGWQPRQLLATADAHLYRAKRRGRGRRPRIRSIPPASSLTDRLAD